MCVCVCLPVYIMRQRDMKYDLRFPSRDWRDRSPEVKDLLMCMLVVDPAKRISAQQALEHPWIARSDARTMDLSKRLFRLYAQCCKPMPSRASPATQHLLTNRSFRAHPLVSNVHRACLTKVYGVSIL